MVYGDVPVAFQHVPTPPPPLAVGVGVAVAAVAPAEQQIVPQPSLSVLVAEHEVPLFAASAVEPEGQPGEVVKSEQVVPPPLAGAAEEDES